MGSVPREDTEIGSDRICTPPLSLTGVFFKKKEINFGTLLQPPSFPVSFVAGERRHFLHPFLCGVGAIEGGSRSVWIWRSSSCDRVRDSRHCRFHSQPPSVGRRRGNEREGEEQRRQKRITNTLRKAARRRRRKTGRRGRTVAPTTRAKSKSSLESKGF